MSGDYGASKVWHLKSGIPRAGNLCISSWTGEGREDLHLQGPILLLVPSGAPWLPIIHRDH